MGSATLHPSYVLARTLAGAPRILILDEATAHVDSRTEEHVQHAPARLRGEIMLLVIAHRLSTIQAADPIIVLHHGAIAAGRPHAIVRAGRLVPESVYLQGLERRSEVLEAVGVGV